MRQLVDAIHRSAIAGDCTLGRDLAANGLTMLTGSGAEETAAWIEVQKMAEFHLGGLTNFADASQK